MYAECSNTQARSGLHTRAQHPPIMPQRVRTWDSGKGLERKLKKRKKARLLCPVCNPGVKVEWPW